MSRINGRGHTIKFLEDALNGARAPAAGHGHVEFVVVVGHCIWYLEAVVAKKWRLEVGSARDRMKTLSCGRVYDDSKAMRLVMMYVCTVLY